MTDRGRGDGRLEPGLPGWFRLLLRVVPRDFRDRYQADFGSVMETYLEGKGRIGRAIAWMGAASDVVMVGMSMRLGTGRGVGMRGDEGVMGGMRRGADSLMQDVRHSVRALRRDLGFATFSVLIVGLGVGASATVFGVANALLLEPLPFDDPEELVWISNGEFGRGQALSSVSVQVGYVEDLQQRSTTLAGVAGYFLFDFQGDHTISGSGVPPERVTRLRVTGNFFSLLGVDAAHGRLFTADEVAAGGAGSIVLLHSFWMSRFGGDPSIVGRAVTIDDAPLTVIGVLPEAFDFRTIFSPGAGVDYVAPYPLDDRTNRQGNTLGLIARLAPGVTVLSAQTETTAIAESPTRSGLNGFRPQIRPLRDRLTGDYRTALLVLAGAVTLVMLIVCANLSNLLIARGIGRAKEMALRSALGADRGRLVRQLLTESLVLAALGSALGVAIAVAGTGALARMDGSVPLLAQARVDGSALAFALASALVAGLVFGVAPALRVNSGGLAKSMRDGARGASESRRSGKLRGLLVIAEVALACVVLVGCGLLARSFVEVVRVDLGFEPEQTIALRIDPRERFDSDIARTAYYQDALDRLGASPVIDAAGLTDVLPMGFNRRWSVCRELAEECPERFSPYVRLVSEGYLDAMGLTLLAGRDFTRADDLDSPPVLIVNDVFARQAWPGENPIGRSIGLYQRAWEVVGVVQGMRHLDPEEEAGPEIFFSHIQMDDANAVHVIARGRAEPAALAGAVADALRPLDANLPLQSYVPVAAIVDRATSARRFVVLLMVGFAAFALLLSVLGLYAVISYSVSRRKREFGVRLALGASASGVRSAVLSQTMKLALVGVAIGMVAAATLSRSIEGLLFGVGALDPVTFIAVPVVLAAIAGLAGYAPARRASRLDPLESLRAE